jgi:hypothetical protein
MALTFLTSVYIPWSFISQFRVMVSFRINSFFFGNKYLYLILIRPLFYPTSLKPGKDII